ncbi:SH3 domain-containing protein [Ponticoccus alexandrii]|uniref:SH3 domain-containing protein n=2 Tax=Ponticoccus alexandrii TaxID=1943633 RepID=A0ABX7F6M4_9RHOB|nr:SH3 domain-containing protein [Ponticoccus alexandrii]
MLRLMTFFSVLVLAGAAHATTLFVNTPRDGYLNLRSGPSTSYGVQYQMPHGTEVEILRKQGDWAQLRHETGRTGWAASRYLTTWAEEQPRRPGREPGADTTDQLPALYVDAPGYGGLNLRSGPGTGNAVLLTMAQGDRVEELGRTGDWRLLRLSSGKVGWAHGGYLSTEKPRERQPNRTAGGFDPSPNHIQPGFRPAPRRDEGWRNGNGRGWQNGHGNGRRNGHDNGWREAERDNRRTFRDPVDALPELLLRCAGREGSGLANCIARGLIQTQ